VANIPLGSLMLRIASRYARTVQKRLATTGHLFQRRYHAILVDTDAYLLELIRYIHLNPVRAGMVRSAADYDWSSHHAYSAMRNDAWITTDLALGLWHADRDRAITAYREFMAGAEGAEDKGHLTPHPADARILGNDEFLAKIVPKPW